MKKIIPVVVSLFLLYYMSMTPVYTSFGAIIWGHFNSIILYRYSVMVGIPYDHAIIWQGPRGWRLGERPVSGDHIHMSISIYTNGQEVLPQHDRPYKEDIPYEEKPKTCPEPGEVAYTKLWPHSGVHTHCDGLIHVHPWSAPRILRKEGLDVQLGLWFDQVGIRYREFPTGLSFRNGDRFDGNATHQWHLAEYICYKDAVPAKIYTSKIDKVWLGHAYAAYILWFGHVDEMPTKQRADALESVDAILKVGSNGFNGEYPSKCNPNKKQ